MPPLLMGRLLFVENHHEGAGAFVVVRGLSRLVTSWPLKVGLVLQIETNNRRRSFHLNL